jgi:flagellar FliL protein
MADENQDAPASPPSGGGSGGGGGGGSKILVILTALNLVITLGIVGALAVTFKADQTPQASDIDPNAAEHAEGDKGAEGSEEHTDVAHDYGKIITLEQFTVNLSTAGAVTPKFARVNISLEVPNEDVVRESEQKTAQIRNTVIDLFNSKTATDLSTPEGRNYLKEEIKKALNSFMISGKVKDVFFTNFAIGT